MRLNANGTKIWDKTFGGADADNLEAIQQTTDGGFLLGGTSKSGISGDKSQANIGFAGVADYWILKIDGSGNKNWDKTIGGFGTDNLLSMQQTTDNGFILGGFSQSHVGGDKSQYCVGVSDYWIVKINSNGTKLWDKTIGGLDEDRLSVVKQTSDGGFALGGYSRSNTSGDKTQSSKGLSDYWIVKLGPQITSVKESEASFNLSISPNPNQGKFKLQINNVMAAKAEVKISDVLGREILNKDFSIINQQLSEELTLPAAKGMYLLRVNAGNEIMSRKIVVE